MPLNEKFKKVNLSEQHYVFVEKLGPFLKTAPITWELLHKNVEKIEKEAKVSKYMALYKMGGTTQVYRAGVVTDKKPKKLPRGFKHLKLKGGTYHQFVVLGSYGQLPEASGRVWDIVVKEKMKLRRDFAIENYANDPRITKEEELITEILIPTV